MTREFTGWGRIAGYTRRIRAEEIQQWRYEQSDQPGQYLLESWHLEGEASAQNNSQGTNPNAKGEYELLAWVSYYGHWRVSAEGHATITLLAPPTNSIALWITI